MTAVFEVFGEPCGKGRPRFSARTGRTYTPAKTKSYEALVRECYRAQCKEFFPKGTPIRCEIYAAFLVPLSDSRPKRSRKLSGEMKPTKKPDWDNIGKIICDSLNGVAYDDDTQVTLAVVKKRYAEYPFVRVTLTEDAELRQNEQTQQTGNQ